jgi:hypothetical protein
MAERPRRMINGVSPGETFVRSFVPIVWMASHREWRNSSIKPLFALSLHTPAGLGRQRESDPLGRARDGGVTRSPPDFRIDQPAGRVTRIGRRDLSSDDTGRPPLRHRQDGRH